MSQILLHVGYAKSGSSYLQKWFESHPNIFFHQNSADGFIHPLELAKHAQLKDKNDDYVYALSSEFLINWYGDIDLYGGAVMPYNYEEYQNSICKLLKELYPTSKILIVTRAYTSFFKSLYSEHIANGGSLTFKELYSDLNFLSSMHDYSKIIKTYRETFGEKNVLCIPFEALEKDPNEFTLIIESFFTIKNHFLLSKDKVNPSLSTKDLKNLFFFSRFIFYLLKPFSRKWRVKGYVFYAKKIRIIKLFVKLIPFRLGKPLKNEDCHILEKMKGKADLLRYEHLYQPYLKDYLIE